MLVLSRERDEKIVIGQGDSKVTITIVDIRGDKVRIGINAPRELSVHREEVYEAIQRETAREQAKRHPNQNPDIENSIVH
jgi:carbon storage regulator